MDGPPSHDAIAIQVDVALNGVGLVESLALKEKSEKTVVLPSNGNQE